MPGGEGPSFPSTLLTATDLLTGVRLGELLALDLGSIDGRPGERRLTAATRTYLVEVSSHCVRSPFPVSVMAPYSSLPSSSKINLFLTNIDPVSTVWTGIYWSKRSAIGLAANSPVDSSSFRPRTAWLRAQSVPSAAACRRHLLANLTRRQAHRGPVKTTRLMKLRGMVFRETLSS
jgi:hypothetical protein